MQMGALADGGKGKRKTGLQGPEYQGLADNTADGSRAKRMTEVPSWEADGEASSRPSAPRMRWLQDGFFFPGRIEEENRHAADAARRAPTSVARYFNKLRKSPNVSILDTHGTIPTRSDIHKINKIPRLHCKLPPTHSLALSHLA